MEDRREWKHTDPSNVAIGRVAASQQHKIRPCNIWAPETSVQTWTDLSVARRDSKVAKSLECMLTSVPKSPSLSPIYPIEEKNKRKKKKKRRQTSCFTKLTVNTNLDKSRNHGRRSTTSDLSYGSPILNNKDEFERVNDLNLEARNETDKKDPIYTFENSPKAALLSARRQSKDLHVPPSITEEIGERRANAINNIQSKTVEGKQQPKEISKTRGCIVPKLSDACGSAEMFSQALERLAASTKDILDNQSEDEIIEGKNLDEINEIVDKIKDYFTHIKALVATQRKVAERDKKISDDNLLVQLYAIKACLEKEKNNVDNLKKEKKEKEKNKLIQAKKAKRRSSITMTYKPGMKLEMDVGLLGEIDRRANEYKEKVACERSKVEEKIQKEGEQQQNEMKKLGEVINFINAEMKQISPKSICSPGRTSPDALRLIESASGDRPKNRQNNFSQSTAESKEIKTSIESELEGGESKSRTEGKSKVPSSIQPNPDASFLANLPKNVRTIKVRSTQKWTPLLSGSNRDY